MDILIQVTDVVEKLVLVSLLFLSVWSISIVIDRYRFFKKLDLFSDYIQLHDFLSLGEGGKALNFAQDGKGFFSRALIGAMRSRSHESADRELSSFLKVEKIELEKGLSVLATLGANAPFVGLFGTVLGIIRSFAYLGTQSGSATVMTGVSQALYATAVGLFVAIPAVIAYNYYSKKIKDLILRAESLRDLYLSRSRSI